MKLALAAILLALAPVAWGDASWVDLPAAKATELRRKATIETWDDGGAVSNFVYRHPAEVFPAAVVKRAGPVRELPVRLRKDVADFVVDQVNGKPRTLRQYVEQEALDGFLVLHRGAIVFEHYTRMLPDDRHLTFSVTKAFVGTLAAQLESDGRLEGKAMVSRYLPELRGTFWDAIPLRDVADMASGVDGFESETAYTDPAHKIFRMEAALGWQPRLASMPAPVRAGDAYGYIATMGKGHPTGTRYQYSSVDTLMLAQVLERASGRRLADLLSARIWGPMGAEADGLMLLNERGVAIAHAGLAMTLRDLARFGLFMVRRDGIASGARDRMLKEGRPDLLPEGHPKWYTHASYQWDQVHERGVLAKGGFGHQGLYIDIPREVVVVMFGTNATVDDRPVPMPVLKLVPALFPETAVKGP